MSKEARIWHPYFNPCGAHCRKSELFCRCFEACQKNGRNCLAFKAWRMAGSVVGAGVPLASPKALESERLDLESFFDFAIGKIFIDLEGKSIVVTKENVDRLTNLTLARARLILNSILICTERTIPFSPGYLEKCKKEQKNILNDIRKLNNDSRNISFDTQSQVEGFIEEMQILIKKAMDLGLDESGHIVRQAFAYGLGREVLEKRGIDLDKVPIRL